MIPYFSRTGISWFERFTLARLWRRFTVRPNLCRLQLDYQNWSNGISRLELQPEMEVNHQNWALTFAVETKEVQERQDSSFFSFSRNGSGIVCLLRWPSSADDFQVICCTKNTELAQINTAANPAGRSWALIVFVTVVVNLFTGQLCIYSQSSSHAVSHSQICPKPL